MEEGPSAEVVRGEPEEAAGAAEESALNYWDHCRPHVDVGSFSLRYEARPVAAPHDTFRLKSENSQNKGDVAIGGHGGLDARLGAASLARTGGTVRTRSRSPWGSSSKPARRLTARHSTHLATRGMYSPRMSRGPNLAGHSHTEQSGLPQVRHPDFP